MLVAGFARRTLGLVLIVTTVLLWTASNFLASTIFADDSFSKPYFVTYFNTTTFLFFLIFKAADQPFRKALKRGLYTSRELTVSSPRNSEETRSFLRSQDGDISARDHSPSHDPVDSDSTVILPPASHDTLSMNNNSLPPLTFRETLRLSAEFCVLWFLANLLQSKSLEYTTVASATILMSTSGIWTLLFGTLFHVESFTKRKLLGVLASLAGIVMVSSVDWSGDTDKHRGSFPHKTSVEIFVGDVLALASAVFYGVYTVLIKRRIGNEERIDMLLFLGLAGLLNTLFLWPGIFIMDITGLEKFELPSTSRIWWIVLINAFISLVSDMCWAWAVLFSTPLLVTVGLSLSIPLSMIGQMVVNSQTSSITYWLGAFTVFAAFIYMNFETKENTSEVVERRSD